MGKSCDVDKQRKRLMKTLKKLSEKLDDSPPCQVKPYPCTPCCPIGAYSPCGPPTCKCCLVQNCCPKYPSSTPKCCGPFPNSSTSICCPPRQHKCSCYECYNTRPAKCCCTPKLCPCRCCCMPCFSPYCMCKPKYRCCKPCCYKCQPCCNTICLPRCTSDTALVPRKRGKTLTCSKSVELRGGVLYKGCDCDKKNGLQDRCLRYCCINNPNCRTEPASCHCSRFSCGKHLSIRYGKKKNCISYTCYLCGPPVYPCVPCCPIICGCGCRCCCRKKCETECQCSPTTCEVECCCPPCPEPCSPCEPSPEPCSSTCSPCFPTNFPPQENLCNPCGNSCNCHGVTQTVEDDGSNYIQYCPPQCRSCQTHGI